MDSRDIARLLGFLARLAGLAAVVLTTVGYTGLVILDCCDRWDGLHMVGAHVVLASLAVLGIFTNRASLLFVAFVGSFFFTAGWYALLGGGFFSPIGVGNFSYLFAGLLAVVSAVAARAHRREAARQAST
jgi:hypothetical protein